MRTADPIETAWRNWHIVRAALREFQSRPRPRPVTSAQLATALERAARNLHLEK